MAPPCLLLLIAGCGKDEFAHSIDPSQTGGMAGASGVGGSDPLSRSGLESRPPNSNCVALAEPPLLLSEHPCFEGSPPEPGPALVPYDVIAPLWSDGASKRRFLALPHDAAFEVLPSGDWVLPPGGVTVKEFDLDKRLETRFVTRLPDGEYAAFTYVWNEAGTDAERVDDGVTITTAQGTWAVPSQSECFDCHTEAAGISLGLETQQLAQPLTYPATGRTADQLETLAFIGMLPAQSEVASLPAYDAEDTSAAARAYLHSNCSHCHRPGAPGGGDMDLRFHATLANMRICDIPPETGDPTPNQNGRLVTPGDVERSILYLRFVSDTPIWRMPPLGTEMVDEEGERLIRTWLESIDGCP